MVTEYGYHLVDADDLGQWDDRLRDVRSLSVAAGYDYQNSKPGLRVYELASGEQSGLSYHSHDEQVEAFYVLDGTLHVETPDEEYAVEPDQALFVDPGSPQRAFNSESADKLVVCSLSAHHLLTTLRNMIHRLMVETLELGGQLLTGVGFVYEVAIGTDSLIVIGG